MKCPKCGNEIADDSKFCEFCGAKISKLKSIKVLWVVLIVLLGFSVLGVGSFFIYESHLQHKKEFAEAKAAQEEAERQAEEALSLAEEAKEQARQDSIRAEKAERAKKQAQEDASQAENRRKVADRRAILRAQGWVDLGLPSGTLWKDRDEEGGRYSYNRAFAKYGNQLPTKEQFEELLRCCNWVWNGKGYDVTGSNGEMIILSATGGGLRMIDINSPAESYDITEYLTRSVSEYQDCILRFSKDPSNRGRYFVANVRGEDGACSVRLVR